ncbi:MAG: DUF2974 domain-containing protein [Lachnospiraceae bacterium]|nr:DUF2974 domain-containing protein [Lachnospiraceae bacterium]
MKSIIDYVKEYGDVTFSEEALNEVDSLVLCQLAYLDFQNYVPGPEEAAAPVSIQTIYGHKDQERIFEGYWYKEELKELIEAAALSVRFGSLKMNYYVNIIDEENEIQFSAMTYVLDDKSVYIAYRGTDANLVGWKEDFNLAYSKPVYSQLLAVEYMNKVVSRIAGKFYTGGHSKGGNLAVYAAMNCAEEIRKRLICVYNNDGPGFRPEILEAGCYDEIADKVIKFIPRSSAVGMILESGKDYEIVESRSIGMFQHNAFSWKVKEKAFVRAENMHETKIFWDNAMNEWILSLSQEEIRSFIDTLYEVVSASEAKNLFQLGADWKKSMQGMIDAVREIDDETRKALQKLIRSLFETASDMAFTEMKEKQQEVRKGIREKKQKIVDTFTERR